MYSNKVNLRDEEQGEEWLGMDFKEKKQYNQQTF